MKHWAQNRFNALLSACVLSLIATAGWSQSLTWLGVLPDDEYSSAYAVSADGAVVVGASVYRDQVSLESYERAFRWTASGGMQDLGTLPGYDWSEAWGVSADGTVVVGRSYYTLGYGSAFRWTASGGMQDLGTLPGYDWSEAWGVSADGTVVVGRAENAAGDTRAFRWTASGGMQDLGTLGGEWSDAWGVSADGTVVVGVAQDANRQGRAFRWTASDGMEDLNTTYDSLLTPGSVLVEARAISPNGRYIVGEGYNIDTNRTEAFLLDTGFPPRGDVNRNGCVDDADLLQVLFAFGERGYRNEDLNWDGTVDDADLLEVLFNFGGGC
jgi:probable HAF family extracellular repeat protein